MYRGEKMEEKNRVPEKCPLIDKCMELVFKEEYEDMCLTSLWAYCEAAKDEVLKYKKRPVDWKNKGGKEE